MIQVVQQDDQRYTVYDTGEKIGDITVSYNPYHNHHCYLNLGLTRYQPQIAAELFRLLRQKLNRPLQVMLYASQTKHDFLVAGGFERKRRCYELEAHAADLTAPLQNTLPLTKFSAGTAAYDRCCKMLYDYYSQTHRAISPLTVDVETFCADLPGTVFCRIEAGEILHYAFIQSEDDGCEIAYVGSVRPTDFESFAQSLVAALFRESDFITAECDDVDPAVMALKSLFRFPDGTPFDTYILE